MRTSLIALLVFAQTAFTAVGAKAVSLAGFTPEARFEASNDESGVLVTVDIEPADFNTLLDAAGSPEWNGSQPDAIVRWVILPNAGNAELNIREIDAFQTDNTNHPPFDAEISRAEAVGFASLGKPQVMRGVRMAPLAIKPLILDETGNSIVTRRIELEIEFTGGQGENEVDYTAPISPAFESLIRSMALNPPARFPGRDLADPYLAKMLILRPSSLNNQAAVNRLNAFADWKKRQGYDVTLTSVNVANTTPAQIRNIIREGYPEDPYDYVLLIGWYYRFRIDFIGADATLRFPAWSLAPIEPDTVITYGDLFYATLDNEGEETDDWLPDVLIGRMNAHSPDYLQAVLNRSMLYEQDPYPGDEGEIGDWFLRAMHCEDNNDTSAALKDADHEMAHWVENNLAHKGMTTEVFKGNKREVYGPEQARLAEGICWGSADGYMFGVADSVDGGDYEVANTGRMHPFIVTNAFYYNYPHLFPFFSSGTVNEPNGPIGAVAFVTDHWEAESRPFVGGALRVFLHDDDRTLGNYWLGSAMGVMGTLATIPEDNELAREFLKRKYSQVMMLGDPSVKLFTALPKTMTSDIPETLYPGATALAFTVSDDDDEPVSNATVCITQGNRIHWVGMTDDEGFIAISIPEGLAEGNAQITVSKQGYKPIYLPNVIVDYPAVNLILQNFALDPDPLVNGGSSGLSLTIENDGEEDGTELDVDFRSDSPFLTFSRNSAALVDIESGGNGGLSQVVNLILSPSCPGESVIQVLLNLSSRNDRWQAAFEIETAGPRYEAPMVDVVYQNLQPGAQATVSPRLHNNGDRNGIALNATLVSLNDFITVTDAQQNYPVIAAGNSSMPGNAFRIAIDSLFVPGQAAKFELRLSGDGNVQTSVFFETIVSEADSDDPIGPDNYGYYAFDSGDEGWSEAPAFNWFEINPDCETGFDYRGEKIEFEDDDDWATAGYSSLFDLPFSFRYYGRDYDRLVVNSNGWVSFDTLSIDYRSPNNEGVPGWSAAPDAQLAICWQDLFTLEPWNSGVYTYFNENDGFFIIEWSDIQQEQVTPDSAQFQIVLFNPEMYETATGDGEILFQYRRYAEVSGAIDYHWFATIGIRSPDGNDGIQYRHSFGYHDQANEIENEFAIKFTTSLESSTGTVRGRFARLENPQEGLAGVRIFSLSGINAVSGQDGSFEFTARTGAYRIPAKLRYFNDLIMNFSVREGEVTDLGNQLMVHPEIANVPEQMLQPLRPNFPANMPVFFNNNGNGELEYSTSIVHTNGVRATFDTLRTIRIAVNLGNDRSTTSPVYVSPNIYLPRYNDASPTLTAVNREGQPTGEEIPLPGRDTLESTPISVTWDGTHFWGSFKYWDDPHMIIEFDRQGNAYRQFVSPFEHGDDQPYITFSPERGTLFSVRKETGEILEISVDTLTLGVVVNRWNITFPGEAFNPSGIGWNSWDTDYMPLYIVEEHWINLNENTRGQRLIRFDPETGEYAIWTYVRNINVPGANDRKSWGIAFMNDYDREQLVMILNETAFAVNDDYLKFISVGPNVPFISDRLWRSSGTVQAGAQGWFVIPFDATGMEMGEYPFGVQIRHNGIGDSVFVPVMLVVTDTTSAPDDLTPLPIDFGITKIYPNPFNSRLGVDFLTPPGTHSSLKVFDVNGRELATLFDGVSLNGRERLVWDADAVSTGVYILQLKAGEKTMTRKAAMVR